MNYIYLTALGLLKPSGLSIPICSKFKALQKKLKPIVELLDCSFILLYCSLPLFCEEVLQFRRLYQRKWYGKQVRNPDRCDAVIRSNPLPIITYRNQQLECALRKSAKYLRIPSFYIYSRFFIAHYKSESAHGRTHITALNTTPSKFYRLPLIDTRHTSRFKTLGLSRKNVK
jgi:hypothetical protein